MTYDELHELSNDALDAKLWLALRDPSERRMMCMYFTPPEYTKNFNELYEAEKALSPEQYSKYVKLLLRFAGPLAPELEETLQNNSDSAQETSSEIGCAIALRATSRQRAEALSAVLRGHSNG